MAGFIAKKALSANRLEFINQVVNHLTAHGVMEPARLHASPFTDVTPSGPDGLFKAEELEELMDRRSWRNGSAARADSDRRVWRCLRDGAYLPRSSHAVSGRSSCRSVLRR